MENTISKNKTSDKPIDEKNKPPFWTQRVASGIIDVGLLLFLLFIFISVFRISPLGDTLSSYEKEMAYIQKDYATKPLIEGSDETYSYKVYINDENKEKYSNHYQFDDGDNKPYVLELNPTENDELKAQLLDAFKTALNNDKKYESSLFNYRLVDYGISMLSATISETILILIIPLINKRRATIGQFLGGIRCINSKFDSPAKWYKILIKYFWVLIFEIALPVLSFMGIYAVVIVPIILYILALFNKNKRTIRDYVSTTKLIDNKSYEPLNKRKLADED